MKAKNKKLIIALLVMVLFMATTLSAYAAAWDSFSKKLPKNQGTVEVSTVALASSKPECFTVNVSCSSSSFDVVCAWAEGTWGVNYSNPSKQIDFGKQTNVNYYSDKRDSLTAGKNMVLNLKNPVKKDSEPTVSGKWTPN